MVTALSAGLTLYALYWTQFNVTTQVYRASFLGLSLLLGCFCYPLARGRDIVAIAGAAALAAFFGGAFILYASGVAWPEWAAFDPLALATLGAVLVITLAYYLWDRQRGKGTGVGWWDVALGVTGFAASFYLVIVYQAALHRVTNPTPAEVTLGILLIAVSFEATRRSAGMALPLTGVLVLLYGWLGPVLPEPFDHRGYGVARIVGQNYLTLEGIFGVPLDVAATFIILFTIYGAVLEYSGAGKFFLDWSFAAMGKSRSASGVGRAVTLAGFLFGTVSGSGVATTVTLGTLAWPMLKKAGYDRDTAAGVLAASGIGAILSPPTLGAAAFLIAEYLRITYLDVLVMALIPTLLYYASCFVVIAAEGHKLGKGLALGDAATESLWLLTRRFGYHFTSLFLVAVLMGFGLSVFASVYWSTMIAFALSFFRPETRLSSTRAALCGLAAAALVYSTAFVPDLFDWVTPGSAIYVGFLVTVVVALWTRSAEDKRLMDALEAGGKGALSIAATTAVAGVLVSIVTLTGLGLKISGIIVDLALGVPFLTVAYAALAVLVLGLAVPVTASYIIAAVTVVPALTQAGVSEAAAHMFVFYYAVLSDVTPPTALSPYAAASITGGRPFWTMVATWKFCLPAFIVPFVFTLDPKGPGLLLLGGYEDALEIILIALVSTVVLALAVGGVARGILPGWRRVVIGLGGLLLLVPIGWARLAGAVLSATAIVPQTKRS